MRKAGVLSGKAVESLGFRVLFRVYSSGFRFQFSDVWMNCFGILVSGISDKR